MKQRDREQNWGGGRGKAGSRAVFDAPDVDALVDGDRAVAEADAFAERLDALGAAAVAAQLDVLAVRLVEQDRPTLHGRRARVSLR